MECAYFKPIILEEGALPVVPRFTQRHRWTHIPQKRAVSSFESVGNVTTQQCRLHKEIRNKTAQSATPTVAGKRIFESSSGVNQHAARLTGAAERNCYPLPSTINHLTWREDFQRLEAKYLDPENPMVVIAGKMQVTTSIRV